MRTTLFRAGGPLAATLCLSVLVAVGCQPKQDEVNVNVDTTAVTTPPVGAPGDTGSAITTTVDRTPVAPATPPDHIEVQHVLIGVAGKVPGKTITRTAAESEALANDILARARRGEDFDQLVQKYTDDQWPGFYGLANTGVTPAQGEYPRADMVKGFSDVAFSLSPGNVGMSKYDPETSPFGYHIIMRTK
jgi:hypothetical protein